VTDILDIFGRLWLKSGIVSAKQYVHL